MPAVVAACVFVVRVDPIKCLVEYTAEPPLRPNLYPQPIKQNAPYARTHEVVSVLRPEARVGDADFLVKLQHLAVRVPRGGGPRHLLHHPPRVPRAGVVAHHEILC